MMAGAKSSDWKSAVLAEINSYAGPGPQRNKQESKRFDPMERPPQQQEARKNPLLQAMKEAALKPPMNQV